MSTVDVRSISGTNCYLDESAAFEVKTLVNETALKDIHFIGSGNYHYLSYFYLGRIKSPFFLILFDNHPDCQAPTFGDILSCGGWVKKAVSDYPLLLGVFIVGADSEHIAEEELFPDIVTIVSNSEKLPKILEEAFADIYSKNDDAPGIYISIDKDVLSKEFAVTDWDQGNMTVEELCDAVRSIGEFAKTVGAEILGADICGDSKSEPNGPDHPVNSYVNNRLIEVISPLISC